MEVSFYEFARECRDAEELAAQLELLKSPDIVDFNDAAMVKKLESVAKALNIELVVATYNEVNNTFYRVIGDGCSDPCTNSIISVFGDTVFSENMYMSVEEADEYITVALDADNAQMYSQNKDPDEKSLDDYMEEYLLENPPEDLTAVDLDVFTD